MMFSSLFDIWLIVLQLNGPLVFFGKRKDVEACRESHILVWHIYDLWRSSVRWFLNLTFKFSWICLIAYEKTKQNIQIISIFISVWVKYNLNSMNTLHLQYNQPQSCCWLHSYPDVFFSIIHQNINRILEGKRCTSNRDDGSFEKIIKKSLFKNWLRMMSLYQEPRHTNTSLGKKLQMSHS